MKQNKDISATFPNSAAGVSNINYPTDLPRFRSFPDISNIYQSYCRHMRAFFVSAGVVPGACGDHPGPAVLYWIYLSVLEVGLKTFSMLYE